jgi:hypothetical protein
MFLHTCTFNESLIVLKSTNEGTILLEPSQERFFYKINLTISATLDHLYLTQRN